MNGAQHGPESILAGVDAWRVNYAQTARKSTFTCFAGLDLPPAKLE
jgi:environmental stress-induced protein Ves